MAELPLILFPGLGATGDVFAPQFADFPELIVPEWIAPLRGESLAGYAERFAGIINPGMPCVVGGISFGGMVATEVCKHLDTRALVLIASLQSPREMPRRARWFARLFGLLPSPVVWLGQRLAQLCAPIAWCVTTRNGWSLYRQAWGNSARLVVWSCRAMAGWTASESPIPCPVIRLHGDRDPALPAHCAPGAELVRGGRHVLTLSHPDVVSEAIRSAIR